MTDPRHELSINQRFDDVKVETTIEDGEGFDHEVKLEYSRWIGTNIITDWKIVFINERQFAGYEHLEEITRETIEGIEGTRTLEFTSQLIIE